MLIVNDLLKKKETLLQAIIAKYKCSNANTMDQLKIKLEIAIQHSL